MLEDLHKPQLFEQIFYLGKFTPDLDFFSSQLIRLFSGENICSRLPEDQKRYLELIKSRTKEQTEAHFRAKIKVGGISITPNEHPYTNFLRGDVQHDIIWHSGIARLPAELMIKAFIDFYPDGRSALFFTNGDLKSIKDPEFSHSHLVHDPNFRNM